jgi:hypothetical protein
MPSPKQQLALLSASVALLASSTPALADDPPPPPGTPSIDQYVETVPTSQGGASPGVAKPRVKRLPRRISANLDARSDSVARRLEAIATSSSYGAPQRDLARQMNTRSMRKPGSPFSAAVSAVSDSGDSHVFWLLAAMIVVTTAMVWATARRHRA